MFGGVEGMYWKLPLSAYNNLYPMIILSDMKLRSQLCYKIYFKLKDFEILKMNFDNMYAIIVKLKKQKHF